MAKDETPKAVLQALDMIRGTGGPMLESLDSVEAVHIARVRSIFEDRNIVAIGIAEKETARIATGQLGLVFYVEKKLPKSKVSAGKLLPPVISVADRTAVFTDVQQIGKITPQVNKRRQPIESGFSVGNEIDTGTLGAIVKKGKKLFLLSNSHVLAKSGKGKPGDEIFYPGDADRGSSKLQRVAVLSKILPFEKGLDFINRVDAALAEVDKAFEDKVDFSIRLAKSPLASADPVRGMTVAIRGRTSGNSEGTVKDVHFSVIIPYPGVGKVGFIDQVLCTRYSKPGDSGSIVVDKESGAIVGLHIAGSTEGSIFNPISEVKRSLKFRFVNS